MFNPLRQTNSSKYIYSSCFNFLARCSTNNTNGSSAGSSTFDPFGEQTNAPAPAPAANFGFDNAFGTDVVSTDNPASPTPTDDTNPNSNTNDDFLAAFTTPPSTNGTQQSLLQEQAPVAIKPSVQAMQAMETINVPSFNRGKKEGMLFQEGGVINVMLKEEWRGSQGRISICYANAR